MNQIQTHGEAIKLGEMLMDELHAPSGEMGEVRVLTKLEVLIRDAKEQFGIQVAFFDYDEHLSEEARAHNVVRSRLARNRAKQFGSPMVAVMAHLPPTDLSQG